MAFLVMSCVSAFGADRPMEAGSLGNKGLSDARFYRYELSSFFGLHVANKSGSVVGAQFGLAPVKRSFTYVGPEVSLSVFHPGSLIEIMGAAWYEIQILGAPRLFLTLGVLAGIGIPSEVVGIESVGPVTYAEFGISQEVSDLALVKGQFRPGYLAGNFAFMMTLGVTFRLQ